MQTLLRVLLPLSIAASAGAETYHFEPTEFHTTFSGAHKSVLTIKPGDQISLSVVFSGTSAFTLTVTGGDSGVTVGEAGGHGHSA